MMLPQLSVRKAPHSLMLLKAINVYGQVTPSLLDHNVTKGGSSIQFTSEVSTKKNQINYLTQNREIKLSMLVFMIVRR
jgi:hypothetical protein